MNLVLTMIVMVVVAWVLRRINLYEIAEARRKWQTELAAMEVSSKARRDFVDERLAVIDRQLTILEGRVEILDNEQHSMKRRLERGNP